ncbi:MAG: nitrate reductase molybdenum cofactor assembly chaperone, partial [bacterium]
MPLYPILSALLCYPEQDLLDAMPEIDTALAEWPQAQATLAPLGDLLKTNTLIELQENYVATFDRNPAHSLHLFEHVHGESRDRGQAMVDLIDEYRREGFEPAEAELP